MAKAGFEQLQEMDREIRALKDKMGEVVDLLRQEPDGVEEDALLEIYRGLQKALNTKENEKRELHIRLAREGQPKHDPVAAVRAKYRNYQQWNTARELLAIVIREIDTLLSSVDDYHAAIVSVPYGAYHTIEGHRLQLQAMRRTVLYELARMKPLTKAAMDRELRAAREQVRELRQKEAERNAVHGRFASYLEADKEKAAP